MSQPGNSSATTTGKLKILVTGPTGGLGRVVVRELLDRGHIVTGFSRNPERWGADPRYIPVKGSQAANSDALAKAVEGQDVVISAFAPSHAMSLETYAQLVEGAFRIQHAAKKAKSRPYLLYVGGAGSLHNRENGTVTLDEGFALWDRYIVKGPVEQIEWLAPQLKAFPVRLYAYLRRQVESASILAPFYRLYTVSFEQFFLRTMGSPDSIHGLNSNRAAFYFLEHDRTFDWTFLSPPWFYRWGPRTGQYGTTLDYQPTDEKGRWLGITNHDIAIAIADECEEKSKKWIHWSCYGKQEDALYYYDDFKDLKFMRFEHTSKL